MSEQSQVRSVPAGETRFLLREHVAPSPDSTPVLLLHGVPETSSCWRDVAPRLATGRRVLAPDLPGLGGSAYPGPYDVPSLVAQLAALVELEVPGGRVDVVGHDWGGSLALALAGARPDLVRRIVVANAPFRQVPLRALHIPLFAVPVLPEVLFRLGGRRVVDTMVDLAWRSTPALDDERRAEYAAAYTTRESVAAMLGYYRAAARPRIAAALRREKPAGTPRVAAEKALVLWGALDPVLPVRTGETVVRDLGADCVMVTVPEAGHFVVEEATEVVTQVLLDFLADATTPAPPVPAAPPQTPEQEVGPLDPPPDAVSVATVPVDDPVPPAPAPAKKADAGAKKDEAPAKRAKAPAKNAQAAARKAKAPAKRAQRVAPRSAVEKPAVAPTESTGPTGVEPPSAGPS